MMQHYKQKYPFQQEASRINLIFHNIKCETIPLISLVIQRYHTELEKEQVKGLLNKIYNADVIKKIDESTLHNILELACEIINYDEYRDAISYILNFTDLLFQV